MSLKKGDLILAPFPFTDFSETKLRPAVVLWVSSRGSTNIIICFISSQNLMNLQPEEFLIGDSDPEFANTGLKVSSKVIVSRIVTINRNLITRRIGNLGLTHLEELNTRLIAILQLSN
jgi:mRNA interferase MazF